MARRTGTGHQGRDGARKPKSNDGPANGGADAARPASASRRRRDTSDRVGAMVARHPRKIVVAFLLLFVLSLPALWNISSFLSFNELLPTGDYYEANAILNDQLGSDNVMFVFTTPLEAESVTDVAALREVDHMMTRFEDIPYVQNTVSLPGLVKTLNLLLMGSYTLPPEGPLGDEMTAELMAQALDLYGEALIYDNVLSRDHQAGIGLIIMERGHSLQQYRDWQVEMKELGLEVDENNPWATQTQNQPISIDVIYANLDAVAIEEGPYWILAAVIVAALGAFAVLDRKVAETLMALFVLVVAIAVTVTAGFLVGVNFNLLTMLLIALILAIGIDYAMHVIARYQEERALGYGVQEAITQSARHVGSALFITMVTTVVGFASLFFSRIQAIGQFGIMVGAGMLTAYLACILLLPALLELHDQRLIRKGKRSAGTSDGAGVEARRHALEAELRGKQRASPMGRLAEWNQKHSRGVMAVFLVLGLVVAGTIAVKGVEIWGASYIDPPILDSDTYPMKVLNAVDEAIGIPVEGAVLVRGDMTRPATLNYLEAIEDQMTGRFDCPGSQPGETATCYDASRRDHGLLNGMSTVGIVKLLYPTLGMPGSMDEDRFNVDTTGDGNQDGCRGGAAPPCADGIPDTQAALKRFYDRLYNMPTIQGVMYRVLSDDYDYGVVRYNYAAQPRATELNPAGSLGTDVANYKAGYADLQHSIRIVQDDYTARGQEIPHTFPASGLMVSAVQVHDAILRGNSMSTYVMLFTTFLMVFLFWRRVGPTMLTLVPVLAAVGVQYFIISALGYEVTYVSIILTGMALGIGIDDAVHLVNRFKEEMTRGMPAREAAVLANSEIGKVLVATTVTTLAPFVVITTSIIAWAQNTAWMTIPTLLAALFATIFLLPVLLRWHGERWPQAWVTEADRRRAGVDQPHGANPGSSE